MVPVPASGDEGESRLRVKRKGGEGEARAGAPVRGTGSSPARSLVGSALALAGLEADPVDDLVGTVAGRTAVTTSSLLVCVWVD